MPEELYDKEEIEAAFFNYNTGEGETSEDDYQERRAEWAEFWDFLENYKKTAPERCGGC
tara:strand:- start:3251 stop:3427 length:177 start_codon:yes stop_codon:yes gene_type:complete